MKLLSSGLGFRITTIINHILETPKEKDTIKSIKDTSLCIEPALAAVMGKDGMYHSIYEDDKLQKTINHQKKTIKNLLRENKKLRSMLKSKRRVWRENGNARNEQARKRNREDLRTNY